MSEVVSPQQTPYAVECEEGKTYFWCACGRSNNQPYCDGSHRDTDIVPVPFEAEESKKYFLCGCKKTGNSPFCDGSHNS